MSFRDYGTVAPPFTAPDPAVLPAVVPVEDPL